MRVLFSTTPAHGHLLPLLPLARAFRERGDDVAVVTAGVFGPVVAPEGIELLSAGPTMDVRLAEAGLRTGADPTTPLPETVAELFGGVAIDLAGEETLTAAGRWRPDLLVSEIHDYVGPLVAATLDVPVATLALGPAHPPEYPASIAAVANRRYADRGLTRRSAAWLLDTCPAALQPMGWQAPPERMPLRPEAHRQPWDQLPELTPAGRPRRARPRVLVSFGTVFSSPQLLSPILRALSAADLDLLVTLGFTASAADFEVDHERVTFAGFTPLDRLLREVDLVITHGGAGTTLGTLAAGIPLAVVPQAADHFIQADRVAASGAGLALLPGTATPEAVTEAATTVLTEPAFRASAQVIAAQIAALPAPADVAAELAAALAETRTSPAR